MSLLVEALGEALGLIVSLDHEVVAITLLSLRVSITAVLLACCVAIPLSLFLVYHQFRGKRMVITLIHTGMALPPVVVGLFVYLFLSRNGPLGYLEILYTPTAMITAQMLMAIPILTGISLSAFHAVRKKIRETVISLGATRLQQMLKVVKEARYGIITALVTSFGAAISEVGAIIIVGGNIRFHTRALTTAIVLETRRGNFALAMALGMILVALAFMINFLLTSVQQRRAAYD